MGLAPSGTRFVRWKSLQHDGLEQLQLNFGADGIVVRSALVSQSELSPVGYFYDLDLGPDWRVGTFDVRATTGQALSLSFDGKTWDANGKVRPDLDGCVDIDFQGTPFTNTLPIRRAKLDIGQTLRFRMVYVPLETLEPVIDEQIYTRLEDRRYRYEAADGSFTAELRVDAEGLVADYPPLFTRVPSTV